MAMLHIVDPCGGEQRKRKRLKRRIYRSKVSSYNYPIILIVVIISQGPNFLWHCDGYDKIKPFGIAIHGCIDGYNTPFHHYNDCYY